MTSRNIRPGVAHNPPMFTSAQIEMLKYLALAAMFIDHTNRVLGLDMLWMQAVGRMAFPLFALVLSYNFLYNTRDTLHYAMRLLLLGAFSQLPYLSAFEFGAWQLNIMFTLAFGLLIVICIDKAREPDISSIGREAYSLTAMLLFCVGGWFVEYNYMGLALIGSLILWYRTRRTSTMLLVVASLLVVNVAGGMAMMLVTSAVIPLVGIVHRINTGYTRGSRVFFYVFYPVHLAVLVMVKELFYAT